MFIASISAETRLKPITGKEVARIVVVMSDGVKDTPHGVDVILGDPRNLANALELIAKSIRKNS